MDLGSPTKTKLEQGFKLKGANLTHNNRLTMELHNFTHERIGVITPETLRSFLDVGDHFIDIRINLLTEMTTFTTGMVPLGRGNEEPGKILEPIHVLFLVRNKTHSRTDIISPRSLVRLIIQYVEKPTAKNLAVLHPSNSNSRKRMANLVHMQFDSLLWTIQSKNLRTPAR